MDIDANVGKHVLKFHYPHSISNEKVVEKVVEKSDLK